MTEPPSVENEELANRPQSDAHVSQTAENDEGILAPRCPHCGWQAIDREDAPENYEAAKADVVEHKTKCPASTSAKPSDYGLRSDVTPEAVVALRLAADAMPISRPGQQWSGAADWLRRRAREFEVAIRDAVPPADGGSDA